MAIGQNRLLRFRPIVASGGRLKGQDSYVGDRRLMPRRGAVRPGKGQSSFGTHLLDHLATHGTGLTGGQVTVIALLQVHADFPWCVFTTKTQFYFEVNTHQGGLMFLTS